MTRPTRARPWLAACAALLLGAPAVSQAQDVAVEAVTRRAVEGRVEPGDRVVVKVYREKELSDDVMVNSRGEIVLARIGTIPAAKLTIRELEDTLKARYGRFLRNPAVEVTALRRIAINGEVGRPNMYYLDLAMTLRDAIAMAGGITDLGERSKVYVIHGAERRHIADWEGDTSVTAQLESGDQIVVGKQPWLKRNALSALSTLAVFTSLLISLRR